MAPEAQESHAIQVHLDHLLAEQGMKLAELASPASA